MSKFLEFSGYMPHFDNAKVYDVNLEDVVDTYFYETDDGWLMDVDKFMDDYEDAESDERIYSNAESLALLMMYQEMKELLDIHYEMLVYDGADMQSVLFTIPVEVIVTRKDMCD